MKGVSYMELLLRQIAEATRQMEIAAAHITELREHIADLEVENQRLRDRLSSTLDRLRRMTEGEL